MAAQQRVEVRVGGVSHAGGVGLGIAIWILIQKLNPPLQKRAIIAFECEISAPVGQVIKIAASDCLWNVDVLFKIFRSNARIVRDECAGVVLSSGATPHVMNPLHVLKSKVDNLHGLVEKQAGRGEAQLCLAIIDCGGIDLYDRSSRQRH